MVDLEGVQALFDAIGAVVAWGFSLLVDMVLQVFEFAELVFF